MGEFLSRLAELLHLKQSGAAKLAQMENGLRAARRNNEDRLQDLKAEIRALEARAVQKKQEFDAARGPAKQIVAGEIERILRERNSLRERARIVEDSIDKIQLAVSKIGEAKAADARGVRAEQFDDIAIELDEQLGQLKADSSAARDLERVKYEAPEKEGAERQAEAADAEVKLSKDVMKELRELEAE